MIARGIPVLVWARLAPQARVLRLHRAIGRNIENARAGLLRVLPWTLARVAPAPQTAMSHVDRMGRSEVQVWEESENRRSFFSYSNSMNTTAYHERNAVIAWC